MVLVLLEGWGGLLSWQRGGGDWKVHAVGTVAVVYSTLSAVLLYVKRTC